MNFKTAVFLIFSVFLFRLSHGQNKIPDSLKNYSFEKLKTLFFENIDNESLSLEYANTHLSKAKNEKNTIKIADSYLYLSYISNFKNSILYSDSIINITKEVKDYYYPALGYMIKGYFYYNSGDERKALDLYLEANNYAEQNENYKQQIEIKQFIGGIKYNFGNYHEALAIFKEQYNFIKKQVDFKDNYFEDYIIVLDDLSKTFLRGNKPDSSLVYVKEGIQNSLDKDHEEMYHRFLLTSGSSLYYLKQYNPALDSLNKLEPIVKDSTRLAICLYYRGKIYETTKDTLNFIEDFKRIDSIYQSTEDSFIELRDVYKSLFNFYSKKGTEAQQLNSIKKLIAIDSLLDQDFKYTNVKIVEDFDLPNLKKEKENLENTINNNKRRSTLNYIILYSLLILALAFISKFYLRQKKYKKRYEEIINKEIPKTISATKQEKNNAPLGNIPENVVNDIIKRLTNFEKDKKYLNNDLTLNSLARELNTNSSYLSKIINYRKEQSFSKYINNLRIDYAVNQLKHDKTLRNYTINAIAKEVGYNNSESFSKAFFKEKGIYPSYFIKQLKKQEINKS